MAAERGRFVVPDVHYYEYTGLSSLPSAFVITPARRTPPKGRICSRDKTIILPLEGVPAGRGRVKKYRD